LTAALLSLDWRVSKGRIDASRDFVFRFNPIMRRTHEFRRDHPLLRFVAALGVMIGDEATATGGVDEAAIEPPERIGDARRRAGQRWP
jgi:hypothetical protein